jgi:hypothetical protein
MAANPLPASSAKLAGSQPDTRTLRGIDFAKMQAHLADGYLIKGLVARNSLVGIIGPTGCGKTFFGTHLAVCIASGNPFFGHDVASGLVVYCALEGPVSAENRFVAIRQSGKVEEGIPLRLTPGPINLRDPLDALALVQFVRDAENDHGEKCVAIFADTLSRAMAGGDENGSDDMGALITSADLVRLQTGATLFLIHHHGKDESRGARGHSILPAALDTSIEIGVQGDLRTAAVTKQRDLPSGAHYAFRLNSVELGKDAEQTPVTTCIVQPVDDVVNTRRPPGGKQQIAVLRLLEAEHRTGNTVWPVGEIRKLARDRLGMAKTSAQSVVAGLTSSGFLNATIGGMTLTDPPDETAEKSP